MVIKDKTVAPGENTLLKLNVTKLPSGTPISLYAHVYRSLNPGPTILVAAGVHGDEINGIEIVRRATDSGLFNNLKKGSVIAMPLVNLFGFNNFSRELPDGKDVNRSFPGSKSGSLASRVAATVTRHILPHIDYGIDFHTGGSSIHNEPQIRVFRDDPASNVLAKAFAPPLIIETGLIAKSFRKECFKHNIPMIVYEGGESLRIDNHAIKEGINGIKRVLNHFEMVDADVSAQTPVTFSNHKWIRAAVSGIFIARKISGSWVEAGETLGYITDPYSNKKTKITARQKSYIFGHDNQPVVNQGKALFHIAY